MKQVLLDTDFLLDCCLNRQPFAGDSIQLLSLCELGVLQGHTTPLILSNFYYLLRKNNTHQQVISILEKLTAILLTLPITNESVIQALRSSFTDFEDALQHHACIENGDIQCIVTRNKKDYQHSQIAVMTPTEFLAHLSNNPANHPVTST